MSNDLHLKAVRSITVNASNKADEQYYYIDLIQISESKGASKIANSSDPYKAYCDYIKQQDIECKWEPEPIYLWDIDDSKEAYNKLIECDFDDDKLDKYIVGYKKISDIRIESLDKNIKSALEKDYKLEWDVW